MLEDEKIVSNSTSETIEETAQERFERERLARRRALKKIGLTSAMATFALFSVDDLARIVGKAMREQAGNNQVALQIAQEFQAAGIAFAGTSPGSPSGGPCVLPDGCDCQCQAERQKTADDAQCFTDHGGATCFRGAPWCPALNTCLDNNTTTRTNAYSDCNTNCGP